MMQGQHIHHLGKALGRARQLAARGQGLCQQLLVAQGLAMMRASVAERHLHAPPCQGHGLVRRPLGHEQAHGKAVKGVSPVRRAIGPLERRHGTLPVVVRLAYVAGLQQVFTLLEECVGVLERGVAPIPRQPVRIGLGQAPRQAKPPQVVSHGPVQVAFGFQQLPHAPQSLYAPHDRAGQGVGCLLKDAVGSHKPLARPLKVARVLEHRPKAKGAEPRPLVAEPIPFQACLVQRLAVTQGLVESLQDPQEGDELVKVGRILWQWLGKGPQERERIGLEGAVLLVGALPGPAAQVGERCHIPVQQGAGWRVRL